MGLQMLHNTKEANMEIQLSTMVFYRLVKPYTFSNSNYQTLRAAIDGLIEFSNGGKTKDRKKYWKEMGEKCMIYKITETRERVA